MSESDNNNNNKSKSITVKNEEMETGNDNNNSMSATKKSNKCHIEKCLDRVAKIVGDCRYCTHSHCTKHRLPESHACEKLSNCRQESYEKNSDKLLNGKCVADKL